MSRRVERIAEQIREEVARALRRDVADPRLCMVTLTGVDVAPDLSQALIFWSTLEDRADLPPVPEVERGLERASGYLRRVLAGRLELKRMPRLVFRHDPSLQRADRVLSLLRELGDDEKG